VVDILTVGNQIGDPGVMALAGILQLNCIESLNLQGMKIAHNL
jgi:hypothetical protein